MAGLFDFKSAEDILKERQDTTRKNVMEAFNQPGQYKVRGERTANAVGKILGLLGGQLFADSPEEQVAGKMQRANQLAESLKPVEGESQSQFYNRVAESFNDAGYSQNALKALTLSKQAQVEEEKEIQRQREAQGKLAYEREQDAYEKEQDASERRQAKAKEAQRQRELQDKINYERGQDAYENEQTEAKDLANLYKNFTSESIAAHRADPTKPLVPIKEGGFAPESRLGKLAYDLEMLKNQPPTPSNLAAIASIEKDINSEQVQYDTQLRELSGNLVKDFAGKGKASEVSDWNKGIDLTTNLMSQYENNPSKVRSHLNKYYRPYDGGFLGSSGFNVKEEYQKNVLTTQDGRAYYYDPDNKKFIGWAQ